MLIISSWLCPKCTFILLYATLNLKAYKINNASGVSAESKKVRDVSKGGGRGLQKNVHMTFLVVDKIFHVFSYEVRFIFRFFVSWYTMKYLLIETSGKQYILWTLDCRCFTRFRLDKTSTVSGSQNIPFPLVSVNKW